MTRAMTVAAALMATAWISALADEPVSFCNDNARVGDVGVIFTVPPDKRLVIQHGSVNPGVLSAFHETSVVYVNTINGGVEAVFFVGQVSSKTVLNTIGQEISELVWGAGGPMRVYADPGTDVLLERSYAGNPSEDHGYSWLEVCFSGMLIDVAKKPNRLQNQNIFRR